MVKERQSWTLSNNPKENRTWEHLLAGAGSLLPCRRPAWHFPHHAPRHQALCITQRRSSTMRCSSQRGWSPQPAASGEAIPRQEQEERPSAATSNHKLCIKRSKEMLSSFPHTAPGYRDEGTGCKHRNALSLKRGCWSFPPLCKGFSSQGSELLQPPANNGPVSLILARQPLCR